MKESRCSNTSSITDLTGWKKYLSVAKVLRDEGSSALNDINERRRIKHRRLLSVLIVNDDGYDLRGRPVPELVFKKAQEALTTKESSAFQQAITPECERFLIFMPQRNLSALHKKRSMINKNYSVL